MLILTAESKTMLQDQNPISEYEYFANRPYFEDEAAKYMNEMAILNPTEVSTMLKCSGKLALKAISEAREFPDKSLGNEAIKAFTGVVFDSFDYNSLSEDDKGFAKTHILIVSSLYGLLYPTDIIKPYRLDYNVKFPDEDKDMARLWIQKNTVRLVKLIQEREEQEIICLLPGAASKCLDWKLIKRFAKVKIPDFRFASEKGRLKLPHAGLLKQLRGSLLRELIRSRGHVDFQYY